MTLGLVDVRVERRSESLLDRVAAAPGHKKAPHRCEAFRIWLPELGSNQRPAD